MEGEIMEENICQDCGEEPCVCRDEFPEDDFEEEIMEDIDYG